MSETGEPQLPPEDRPTDEYGPFEKAVDQLNKEENAMDVHRTFRTGGPELDDEAQKKIREQTFGPEADALRASEELEDDPDNP